VAGVEVAAATSIAALCLDGAIDTNGFHPVCSAASVLVRRMLLSGNIACVHGYPTSMEVMDAFRRCSSLSILITLASFTLARSEPYEICPQVVCTQPDCAVDEAQPSWIFSRSTYTHDPETGARVAQYQRLPAIEPLEDERMVTSRYHRTRTNLRGIGGSTETYYDVQSWGNGRGGIDAEWERFHDAWKESFLQGGYYNQGYGYANGYQGPTGFGGYGAPGFGYGFPGNGFPGGYYGNPWWGQGAWKGNGGHGHHDDGHGHHDDGHGHGGDGH
jgi:hypothetical protein